MESATTSLIIATPSSHNRPRFWIRIVVIILLLGAVSPGEKSQAETSDRQPDTSEPSLREAAERYDSFPEPTSSVGRCRGCHQIDAFLSHPVNIAPTMDVPASLPLDYGRISCLTCHDSRVEQEGHASDPSRPGLIRDNQSRVTLCTSCHKNASESYQDMHATSLSRAHLMSRTEGSTSDSHTWPGRLDHESSTCLSCHDGSVASDVGHTPEGASSLPRFANMPFGSHPIGIDYQITNQDPHVAPLKPRSSLDSRIRLFNNQLGCGSCHSPYSPLKNILVMSNQRSALCLTCHDY